MFLGWYRTWTDGPAVTPPVVVVTTPAVGGARRRPFRRQTVVIGDETYVIGGESQRVTVGGETYVIGEADLEQVLLRKVVEKPVQKKQKQKQTQKQKAAPPVPMALVDGFLPALPVINWSAVDMLRAQSERLQQDMVLRALDRAIAAHSAMLEDEREVEMLLLQ